MKLKKVEAIVRSARLESVEKELEQMGFRGFCVSHVYSWGECANTIDPERLVERVKIEIFCWENVVEAIVEAILRAAHTGVKGDGHVAVSELTDCIRIRDRGKLKAKEL